MKPAFLRPRAQRDVQAVIRHYRQEGGKTLARRWVDAVDAGLQHAARFPGSGSQRYASLLGVGHVRCWPLKRFPYLIFYVESEDRVDVWRVLHAQRDLPTWLQEDLTPRANQRTAPGE